MKNLTGKRVLLYRRVSTSEQKKFGNSLNAQQNGLREFCRRYSMIVIKEFEEDYSAKNFDRPEFNRLMSFAKNNKNQIDYVLCVNWDRFSRNTYEALGIINDFKKLRIEINCIEGWIDYEDPTQLMMHLMYLGMPEVDNRIRGHKIKRGNRQALKEGRWIHTQPKGYIPGKDVLGKTLMKPHPMLATLVTELFEDFANGLYSQNQLIKQAKYSQLKLTKSNLSRMLKQIAYAGYIKVSEFKDEPEEIVTALHQPLISIEIFNKIQRQLSKRSRYKQKFEKLNENLPLRGLLQCSKCGGNLTGSASKSQTGAKHYYYHCNPKKGCGERFKVASAHIALIDYFKEIKPKDEICDLFELILQDKFENSEASKKNLLKKKEEDIRKLKLKRKTLLDRLLEGIIDNETYKEAKDCFDIQILDLENEHSELQENDQERMNFVSFGIHLFKNIQDFFQKATVSTKQKIMSSILSEKLVFDGDKYRTPKLNKGFEFIYQNIKELSVIKQKNERLSFDNLPFSTEDGT